VKPGTKGPTASAWYRQWIEVPKFLAGYDLTGARIWFQFKASANGPMPEIIYFNGRRVALGDDLEPIVLFDKAKPGDRVLVAVKLLATVDKKTFNGSPMKIDFPVSRPDPEDERKEFLSAALLIPSLSKNVPVDQATLIKAITAVDLSALDAANQEKFDASPSRRSLSLTLCVRSFSRRPSTSPATPTSMRPGSGLSAKPSILSGALFLQPCS